MALDFEKDPTRKSIIRFITVEIDEASLASSKAIPYVVVVRVNGSHLIKNYLITILALISYAWFSLRRAPQLPHYHRYFFLSPSLPISLLLHLHHPLTASSTIS